MISYTVLSGYEGICTVLALTVRAEPTTSRKVLGCLVVLLPEDIAMHRIRKLEIFIRTEPGRCITNK